MSDPTQIPSVQRIKRDGTFSCFTEPDFEPNAFTSEVMNANKNEGQGIDIDMCLKMLGIYLDTIDGDLRDIVIQNQEKLFNQIGDIKELKTQYEQINGRVQEITTSFESIKSEISSTCKSISDNTVRLGNFNAVVLLLRQITVFRTGIKKIKGFLADENPTQRAWLRAHKSYQEIEKVYIDGHLGNVKCLADDVSYFNAIRVEIAKHVTMKR